MVRVVAQFSFSDFFLGDPRLYKFSAPMEAGKLVEDPFFVELMRTEAFQRLGSVRFLGGIDYLLVRNPNGAPGNTRYTRLQHSLGVARLAFEYSSNLDLSLIDRRLIVAAALLHDIGHAPLSHSIEPVFRECFGIDHHGATRDIILGHVPIGRAVYKLLRSHSINVDRLTSLIAGKDSGFDSFFSGPINFDTIEGILRTRTFGNAPATFAPDVVVDAAINRSSAIHQEIVDQFWEYKDQVYRHVINSSLGILADHACQVFARRNLTSLVAADYFATEEAIFHKLPGLRQLLTRTDFASEAAKYFSEKIHYKARRFLINRAANFFARDDSTRYFQTREHMTLNIKDVRNGTIIAQKKGDLFEDESD
jgi:HD superfamily phosphohydrolase